MTKTSRKEYHSQWRARNRLQQRKWFAQYRIDNRDTILAQQKAYRERNKNKPEYRLKKNLRERLRAAMKGITKGKSTMLLVGCSVEALKKHLEAMFKSGMTWANYGKEWHIDHIKPCSTFDLLSLQAQLECFHYSNLQPLWASENQSKSNKIL